MVDRRKRTVRSLTVPSTGRGSLNDGGVLLVTAEDRRLFKRAPCTSFDSLEAAHAHALEDEQHARTAAPQSSADGESFRFRDYHRAHVAIRCGGAHSSWVLSEWAARQLCKLLRFPFEALNCLSPKVAVEVLTDRCRWAFKEVEELARKDYRYMVPLVSNREVTPRFSLPRLRALNSIAYERLPDAHVLEVLLEEQEGFRVDRVTRGERAMHAWLVNPHCEAELGDEVVSPGVLLRSSEVGNGMPCLYRTIYRHRDCASFPWSNEEGLGRSTLRWAYDRPQWLEDLRGDLDFVRRQRTMDAELAAGLRASRTVLADAPEGAVTRLRSTRRAVNHRVLVPTGNQLERAVARAARDGAYGRKLTVWSLAGHLAAIGAEDEYSCTAWLHAEVAAKLFQEST